MAHSTRLPPDILLEQLPDSILETMQARRERLHGLPDDAEVVASTLNRWRPGQVVRVAFLGGDNELRLKIARVAAELSWHCNLQFDFGWRPENETLRSWSESDEVHQAEIRVSFDQTGYFSLVGTDSVAPDIGYHTDPVGGRPHQRSLNLGGFDKELPGQWRRTVLHEFMHAVAFQHEHSNHRGPCQDEFRWDDDEGYVKTTDRYGQFTTDSEGRRPGIYTYLGGPPNNWSRNTIDHNLREASGPGIATSRFDPASVMLYRFPDLFYKTPGSPCGPVGDGDQLSELDIVGLQYLYPWSREEAAEIEHAKRQLAANIADMMGETPEAATAGADAGDDPLAVLKGILEPKLSEQDEMRESVLRDFGGGSLEGLTDDMLEASVGLSRANIDKLTAEEFEALVRRVGRPSLKLRPDGSYVSPETDPWRALLSREDVRTALTKRARSVGRVELRGVATPIGTAWMIDDDIAVTNQHVAKLFAGRWGDGWTLIWHSGVRIAFGVEGGGTVAEVEEVLYMAAPHEPDIAFLRVKPAKMNTVPEPIPVAEELPPPDSFIVTIGYPGDERTVERHDRADLTRVFQDQYEVKRLAPGRLMPDVLPMQPFSRHDCSTLKGSSGSVVLDMKSGEAIGLHYGGREYDTTRANRMVKAPAVWAKLEEVTSGAAPAAPLEGARAGTGDEAAPTASKMANRGGYNPQFLDEELTVPLPDLQRLERFAVRVPDNPENDPYSLRYHHYSVVLHSQRRLAIMAAVNIDGENARRVRRGRDKWHFDPRVPRSVQSGNDLYRHNPLDRGHLVRRLDPAWGSSFKEAAEAALDTFFWTNCAPQHAELNQKTWLSLEEHLLDHATNKGFRVNVMNGPVFRRDDPEYRNLWRLPREFWKVVTMVDTRTGTLSATAYVISQRQLLTDLEFAFGRFRTYQLPIARLERMTGLAFRGPGGRRLSHWDPLQRQESPAPVVLSTLDDIVV